MKNVKIIKLCRLCKATNLKKIINFGKVPLGNNLQKKLNDSLNATSYKLLLNRCLSCGHFQLGHSVDPKYLYATNYTYLSGVGKSFITHFKNYAESSYKYCKLTKKSLVIDIGSNDGSCLSFFKKKGCKVLGIDPAKVPANIAKNSGINTIIDFFGSNIEKKILKEYGYADFITSHNVLAHIDDIDDVFKTAFNILKYNGYFTFEVGYFLKVLNNNFFDTIYHEHLDYHHARPLAKYLKTIGFSIVKVSTNNIQGGSIRFMCKKENKPKIYKNVQNFIDKEMNTILYDKKYINNWESEIRLTMKKFKNLVVQKKTVRHKIIGYGAPTKATLLLKMSKINPDVIDYIIEDNILKVSRYLPKTKIKIESNMSLNKDKPDLIIIFSWNFADDIITNIKKIIKKPTDLIVPLPNPRIIKI